MPCALGARRRRRLDGSSEREWAHLADDLHETYGQVHGAHDGAKPISDALREGI